MWKLNYKTSIDKSTTCWILKEVVDDGGHRGRSWAITKWASPQKALVSNNEASKLQQMTPSCCKCDDQRKTLLIIFLLALVAIAVASQARIDICRFCAWRELLLESDVEKVQHLKADHFRRAVSERKGKLCMKASLLLESAHSTKATPQLDTVNTEIIQQLELDKIRYESLRDMWSEPNFASYIEKCCRTSSVNAWIRGDMSYSKNRSNAKSWSLTILNTKLFDWINAKAS